MLWPSPLTGRPEYVGLVAEIDIAQLAGGYRSRLGIDVTRLFAGVDRLCLLRDAETGLSFFSPPVVGDVAFYDALALRHDYYRADKAEYRIARDYVRPGARICEVGAGFGLFRDHVPGADFLGLEFNDAALAHAAARNIPMLRRDVHEFADANPAAFDVTCAFQVLEHVVEPLEFVASLVRLTKPGGTILISTPNGEAYIARNRDLLNVPPHHVTWWEDMTWTWLQQRFGLCGLQLHHTPVDECLIEWARMVAVDGLAALLDLKLHAVVDETPMRHRIDALAEHTARIIASGVRHRMDAPPVGHTTLAVFSR
ncbi:MAG TPA: methyltransferase domain-containing protein [Acetobacteraceae bacterium]|jgi:SAM-dependent methyltransferase